MSESEEFAEEPVVLPPIPAKIEPVSAPAVIEDRVQELTQLGDVMTVAEDAELPFGWERLDDQPRRVTDYPEFAQLMNLTGETFTLPAPFGVRPGAAFVVKLR